MFDKEIESLMVMEVRGWFGEVKKRMKFIEDWFCKLDLSLGSLMLVSFC